MKPPSEWSMVTGHISFDVNMDFTWKARWAGVVSRESVKISFKYASLNSLAVWAADIQNAYLQVLSSQRHYIACGAEFGLENVGKQALILKALYGGMSARKDFCNHLMEHMRYLGFT
eukprot:10213955-Ditylum_brightwellii.AAC.1